MTKTKEELIANILTVRNTLDNMKREVEHGEDEVGFRWNLERYTGHIDISFRINNTALIDDDFETSLYDAVFNDQEKWLPEYLSYFSLSFDKVGINVIGNILLIGVEITTEWNNIERR